MREQGIEGLLHKNRGKQSPFRLEESIKEKVITLAKSKYRDVKDTHMKELLFKEEGIDRGRETLSMTLREIENGRLMHKLTDIFTW